MNNTGFQIIIACDLAIKFNFPISGGGESGEEANKESA
jgi:hypothetical protein